MKNLFRKWVAVCLAAVMVFVLSACGTKDTAETTTAGVTGTSAVQREASGSQALEGKVQLTVLIKNREDRSFDQSLYEGAMRIKEEMADRYDVEIVEADPQDQSVWQLQMEEAAAKGADIVACAGYQLKTALEGAAEKYQDTKFILLDDTADYDKNNNSNILSVLFNANEAAFLAGVAAASYTVGENAANTDKTIGFIGGKPSDAVNNYLAGFAQGAHYIDPDMKILSAFTDSYTDEAKAKEVAEDQIREGADILFGAAGASGTGVMEAASAKDGVMAIGVDSDQFEAFENTDLQQVILTSCLKGMGTALYDICDSYSRNPSSIAFGSAVRFGMKESCAGLVYNDNLTAGIGEDDVNKLKEIEQKLLSGEIRAASGEGLTHEALMAIVMP